MIEVISTFSSRLNEALEIREMKPIDLTKKTGIKDATISQYRSGYAKPKEKKLSLIANALNVNPVWLMGLNVPMECDSRCETPAYKISNSEYDIIVAYRKADNGIQSSVLKLLDLEKKEENILTG